MVPRAPINPANGKIDWDYTPSLRSQDNHLFDENDENEQDEEEYFPPMFDDFDEEYDDEWI